MRVFVHDSADEVQDFRDPGNILFVNRSTTSWKDDGFDGLKIFIRGQFVLEAKVEAPLLIPSVHKLSHEESLVDPSPLSAVIQADYGIGGLSWLSGGAEARLKFFKGVVDCIDGVLMQRNR